MMTANPEKVIHIRGYYKQDDEELERIKQQILETIARNDIRFLNLQSMQFMIDDIKYR